MKPCKECTFSYQRPRRKAIKPRPIFESNNSLFCIKKVNVIPGPQDRLKESQELTEENWNNEPPKWCPKRKYKPMPIIRR